MKRWRSAIVVASVITAISVLAITAGPFQDRLPERHASSDAPGTSRTTLVAVSPPAATVAQAAPPRPPATLRPRADQATVVAVSTPATTIVRSDPPSPPATVPPSDPPLFDSTPTSTPATEYVLDIESIGLHEPVVAGGQDEIDQGYVTAVDWSSLGYPASCLPGDGCTVWLAGHRSTHQAVFARLPEITVGALVEIHFDGQAYAYTVTEAATVPGTSPPSVIHGDLVLQTSAPSGQRILVYTATASGP